MTQTEILGSFLTLALLAFGIAVVWVRIQRDEAKYYKARLDELREERAAERKREIERLTASADRLTALTSRSKYPEG